MSQKKAGHNDNTHNTRKGRKTIAEETLSILEEGGYRRSENSPFVSISKEQHEAVTNTVLYEPSETDALLLQKPKADENATTTTEFQVWNTTTLNAVRRLAFQEGEEDIFCLNFASARNPGGGFLNGSQAQEESLARASGLYLCQTQPSASGYYTANQAVRAPFYTDSMIYSPRVPVFREEDGTLMEHPLCVSFLTAPAVNASTGHQRNPSKQQPKNASTLDPKDVQTAMRRRISKILAVAHHHGHETLVLGAWGCGVFANDPADIAKWFQVELSLFHHSFRKVVFAIYSPSSARFIAPFQWEFERSSVEDKETVQQDNDE